MDKLILLAALLLPVLGGGCIPLIKWKKRIHMFWYVEVLMVIISMLVWNIIINCQSEVFEIAHFTGDLTIALQVDGLAIIFAGIISVLWPLATIYTFEYMKHEEHERTFFFFFTATYGVTIGIAFAANYLTMYFFYELLTLVTVPLVMHTLTREAILASRKYLYYSLGGAAFAFIGLIFMIVYGNDSNFIMGGILDAATVSGSENKFLIIYVLAFFGFGVKAAICPFNAWLPQAGVAPTPVTALLHAVAVVKSGAFVIIRLTFYCFGADFIRGTWAQNIILVVIIITIIYGSSMAVKETHLKRRLAYSTISNLSYILFGIALLTPLGLVGALCHLVFHAVMKITSFFCAGAIIYKTDRHYVHQLDGLAYKMPKIFGIFTIASFALMGVPGLAGFISKWHLAKAAVDSDNLLATIGIGALLVSALLTAIYMLSIVIRAYFPEQGFDRKSLDGCEDPNWYMMVPLVIFVVCIFYFGLNSNEIVAFITEVAYGIR